MTAPVASAAAPLPESIAGSRFMSRVYRKLAIGLSLSAAIAWMIDASAMLQHALFTTAGGGLVGLTGTGWLVMLSPLLLVIGAPALVRTPTARTAGIVYWATAILMGAGLATLGLTFAGDSLASVMLICGLAFAGLSLWGARTRRDLTGMRTFFATAVFGLIAALFATILLDVSLLVAGIDLLGVVVFSGLIAADTQRLRRLDAALFTEDQLSAASSYGALTLYLNAINLVQFVVGLVGRRR